MITAEVSLYPMETPRSDDIINASLTALAAGGLSYDVGPLSTRISGSEDEVWHALRSMFERACGHGKEVAMVVTLANSTV
ncbi:MAG: Ykof family thiamine-binding protein [Firmicutes bacterium]|nr:Ykof family thiamine-binding protein [Bacillota bacterium]MDH7496392.1 YkoF family thiamine/hydroxymethylpyrimidine-binding protein [Bacillota bacterium]